MENIRSIQIDRESMVCALVTKDVSTPSAVMLSIKQAEWLLARFAYIHVIVGLPVHGRYKLHELSILVFQSWNLRQDLFDWDI